MGFRVAVASTDNIVVNQHFGHTNRFYIYDVVGDGDSRFVEERPVQPPCSFGEHDDSMMEKAVQTIRDCRYVICNRIGGGALEVLHANGMEVYEMKDYIDVSLKRLLYLVEHL